LHVALLSKFKEVCWSITLQPPETFILKPWHLYKSSVANNPSSQSEVSMMKSTLAITIALVSVGLVGTAAVSSPIENGPEENGSEGSAADLILSEEDPIAAFERDADRLNQLSTQINDDVNVNTAENNPRLRVVRPSREFELPNNLIIIDSNDSPVRSGEAADR
jgi:hypothetical protein